MAFKRVVVMVHCCTLFCAEILLLNYVVARAAKSNGHIYICMNEGLDEIPPDVNRDVLSLILDGNHFGPHLSNFYFSQFENLQNLSLVNNRISDVYSDTFSGTCI